MASRDSDQKLPMFTKCDIDLPDNSCDDGNLGYEETLVSSHPAASSVIPAPAPTKKAKPTKKPQDPPITTFQRAWVEMKLNCVDPKTSLNVVKTMKAEVLSALVNSNLLPSDLTDKLEMQWDILGPDQVTMFLNLFLTKRDDRTAIVEGGAGYFLEGMIAASQTHTKIQLLEAAESFALVKTDLDLTVKSLAATRTSMSESEDSWRAQSSLISNYSCQLESMLKTTVSNLETHQLRVNQETHVPTSQPPPTVHGNLMYVKVKDKVTICALPDTPQDETIAAKQIQHLMDRMPSPDELIPFDPVFLMEEFQTTYQTQKTSGIKAFNMVLTNLRIKSLIPEKK
ncbi:hypothetical protein JYU34_000367 [Plutella xylostella]|uniref:Cyclic nucleotide-binding domain-containing protein n=2 Tax=Plutella xylostella TaxID=51655 RepID=A0ABQ7R7I3_PLUXY|nr:hypothetical protein JYU34_000363 [Plutella xylostella]KAG7313262.1 hypothetical protein JYU34_000364 [Plutella xylostella]KAG7313265.1 hypothetical protein JYU34_000367 [Plutella xylostella]